MFMLICNDSLILILCNLKLLISFEYMYSVFYIVLINLSGPLCIACGTCCAASAAAVSVEQAG